MKLIHTLTVVPPAQLQRIDIYLSTKLRKFSRNKIQNLIFRKAVLVNSNPVEADYKLQWNDRIEVYSPFNTYNENVTPENIPIEIIYEDASIIVVNKPSGMPVHKGLGNYRGTLLNALAYHFIACCETVNIEQGAIHRLDSGTSGLIVFAKNKNAKKHLEKQIKNNAMHRTYHALVWGIVAENDGEIDVPIGRNPSNPMVIQAFPFRDHGKASLTNYTVVQRFRFATLVQCHLFSGRTHQIRIHMQFIGHALLGDPRYASNFKFKDIEELLVNQQVSHQLLHAHSLQFEHPETSIMCHFEAPYDNRFEVILASLKQ